MRFADYYESEDVPDFVPGDDPSASTPAADVSHATEIGDQKPATEEEVDDPFANFVMDPVEDAWVYTTAKRPRLDQA